MICKAQCSSPKGGAILSSGMEAELRAARELVTELETAAAEFDKRLEVASADGEKAASEARAAAASAAKDLAAAVEQVHAECCFGQL